MELSLGSSLSCVSPGVSLKGILNQTSDLYVVSHGSRAVSVHHFPLFDTPSPIFGLLESVCSEATDCKSLLTRLLGGECITSLPTKWWDPDPSGTFSRQAKHECEMGSEGGAGGTRRSCFL